MSERDNELRPGATRRLLGALIQSAILLMLAPIASRAAVPDLSGIWIPDDKRDQPLQPPAVPFTGAAKVLFDQFDKRTRDSSAYCMPFGTPRNVLGTAAYPLEIIQQPKRITMLFSPLNDVRKIYMDGRPHPQDVIPTWMGHSVGQWDADALVVDTVSMTGESILNDSGLPHSEQMQVSERFSLLNDRGMKFLQVEIKITDPQFYSQPLHATRYFRWAPDAPLPQGSVGCLIDQRRASLEANYRALFHKLQGVKNPGEKQP